MIEGTLKAIGRWLLAAVFVATIGSAPALADTPAYRLGYGDSLTVTVVGQPGLSVEAQPIRPDGKISLPLVQEVAIQGKSVPEVTSQLTKAFRPYLVNPQVVVSIAKFRPLRVTLLGQVSKPGTYQFDQSPTLLEALASAGGVSERAARDNVRVRLPSGKLVTYNVDALFPTGEVPRMPEGSVIEVGEVWGPDWYRVVPVVASALTAAVLLYRYTWY